VGVKIMRIVQSVCLSVFMLVTAGVLAADAGLEAKARLSSNESVGGYLARIELKTPEEVHSVLDRAEELFSTQDPALDHGPIAFVLHSVEARIFLKENYASHKKLVDQAARLSSLGVIDIKICRTWMGANDVSSEQLVPFVGTVEYGVAEVKRLMSGAGYVYF